MNTFTRFKAKNGMSRCTWVDVNCLPEGKSKCDKLSVCAVLNTIRYYHNETAKSNGCKQCLCPALIMIIFWRTKK